MSIPRQLPVNFPCWKPLARLAVSGSLFFFLGNGPRAAQLFAQDPMRFEDEVRELLIRNDSVWDPASPGLVFTGSSSIRMWDDLQDRFPNHQILNSGFGGSQATDLLFFLNPLVLDYSPERVFIYEGDNDLAEGKNPGQVLKTLEEIAGAIHTRYPDLPIVFIASKPSISRWGLRGKYRRFNRRLEKWTKEHNLLYFADVWNPMLNDGKLDESLFIDDGLHMKPAGYDIWEDVLQPLIDNPLKKPEP